VLAGNHGLEIAGEGVAFEHPIARERADLISDATELVREAVGAWPEAWVENKRLTATIHFRQVDQRHHCNLAIAVRRAVARFGTNVGLRAGKCSLEIHPRVQWNKGSALAYIRRQLGMEDSPVLCIGDDPTDETMFRSLPGHVTVCVGQNVRTAAVYRVPDATAVGHALQVLCELVTGQLESFRTTA
jgi:trehalose 6-phosphate phosphatase